MAEVGRDRIVALFVLGAIFGEDDSKKSVTSTTATEAATARSATGTSTTEAETAKTFGDAEQAVASDDFPAALAIAAALGGDDENRVRRVISRRLGRRVLSALRRGDRSAARVLLAQADAYPATKQIRTARSSYRASKARAAYRTKVRRQARAARRRQQAADRAAAKAKREAERQAETQALADPGTDDASGGYAGMNCDEIGHSFTVTPGSDPEHDRDNDGLACESQ